MRKTTDLAGPRAEMIGAGRFATLVEGWRGGGSGPLSRRLARVIRSRISSGLLGPGTILPPERSLAATLGVSRSTVVAAIDELRAGGFVASRQGSGTWVSAGDPSAAPPGTTAERLLPAEHILNLAASVSPDASQLPDVTLDVADLASVVPAHGYAPAGLPVLREAIARRHHALAVPTSPAQIHVTNGAQHALDLALGAVARRGDIIAVEDPTYVGVRDLLRGRGLRALPLPLDLIDDPGDQLSKLLIAGRARAVLLVPAVHSPTGRVRRRLQLEALARQLDTARLPAIEDNTLADLAFTGGRPPSLASLCRRAPVISVESTSKVGWGGLRVGWIRAAPDLIDATVSERGRTDYGTSVPSQLVALQLLSTYDQVIGGGGKPWNSPRRRSPGWCASTSPTGHGSHPTAGSPPGSTLTSTPTCCSAKPCATGSRSRPDHPRHAHRPPALICEPASTGQPWNSKPQSSASREPPTTPAGIAARDNPPAAATPSPSGDLPRHGHQLPEPLAGRVINLIIANTARLADE